jgi:hypothetical protein
MLPEHWKDIIRHQSSKKRKERKNGDTLLKSRSCKRASLRHLELHKCHGDDIQTQSKRSGVISLRDGTHGEGPMTGFERRRGVKGLLGRAVMFREIRPVESMRMSRGARLHGCLAGSLAIVAASEGRHRVVLPSGGAGGPADVLGASAVLVDVEVLGLVGVEVLARVGGLVFEVLDEVVETDGEEGAKEGSQPVDPVVAREETVDDAGPEGAGWVEGACE